MVSVCHNQCKHWSMSERLAVGSNINFFRRWCKTCGKYVEIHLLVNNRCPCCKCLPRMNPRGNNSIDRREKLELLVRI